MDVGTIQGLTAVGIGVLLCALGYWKGKSDGVSGAVEALFDMGVLAVDENDHVVAGPEISKVKLDRA